MLGWGGGALMLQMVVESTLQCFHCIIYNCNNGAGLVYYTHQMIMHIKRVVVQSHPIRVQKKGRGVISLFLQIKPN